MSQSQNAQKRTYDDITFQKRRKLIRLIQKQRWTIKAAARQMGIKLCTAKHILYLYRKEGKIYRKKGQIPLPLQQQEESSQIQTNNIVYVPLPYYVFCFYSPELVPINLEHYQQV